MNVSQAISGVKAAVEEFGKEPPSQELRQSRADVCTGRLTGKPCPQNYLGAWRVTDVAVSIIKGQLERKRDLALRVEGEDKLGTCEACSCPLFLKVHYNFQTIYDHTSDQQFEKLRAANPECWQWKERVQHQTKP